MQWLLVACSDATCGARGSSSRADAGRAVIEWRASQGADDGSRPLVSTVRVTHPGASPRRGTDRRGTDRYPWEAGWPRRLPLWNEIVRRDLHGTPEAGSSGL